MLNIYGYFSPDKSLKDEMSFCSAEDAQQHCNSTIALHRGMVRCSGAFPKMSITAVYGHQRMTSVIQKLQKVIHEVNGL